MLQLPRIGEHTRANGVVVKNQNQNYEAAEYGCRRTGADARDRKECLPSASARAGGLGENENVA